MVRPITSEKHTPSRPNGERDARAVHDAREQVAAHAVGAEQEHHPPVGDRKQVAVGREQPPEPVLRSATQQPDRVALAGRPSRLRISSDTGLSQPNDMPKSPRITPHSQIRYCCQSGLSRP